MIQTAIVLAAGEGSRLRAVEPYKPLCRVGGIPLIDHALSGLAFAGITRAVVVLGYGAPAIEAHLASRAWPLAVETVTLPDWRQPNGVSALAGGARIDGPALLVMCDHLVDPALYARVAARGAGTGLRLGVDRRLDQSFVDLDDVTRVATAEKRIVAIGKHLPDYDAFDTGVFAVGPSFFAALAGIERPSVSDGVSALLREARAKVVDCSGLDWIDVDDAAALARAELWLAERSGASIAA